MGFSRREYWSGLPLPSPGHLPNPGIKPASPAVAGGFCSAEPPGTPKTSSTQLKQASQGLRWRNNTSPLREKLWSHYKGMDRGRVIIGAVLPVKLPKQHCLSAKVFPCLGPRSELLTAARLSSALHPRTVWLKRKDEWFPLDTEQFLKAEHSFLTPRFPELSYFLSLPVLSHPFCKLVDAFL